MSSNLNRPPLPWALIVLFVVISPVLLIAGFNYSAGVRDRIINSRKDELKTVADLQVDQIVQWKHEKLIDANVISDNIPIIRQIGMCFYHKGDESDASAIRLWMGSFIRNLDYFKVAIADNKGRIRFSSPENDTLIGPLLKPLISKVLRNKQVVFTDFHRVDPGQIVHLDLIIPLLLTDVKDTMVVGLMIMRIDPNKKLYPLISKWSAKSRSSETLLLRRDGDSIVYLNDLKYVTGSALKFKKPLDETNLVGAIAVRGFEGVTEGVDYRNVPVIAAAKKIPGSDWYMISKVDLSEIKVQASGELLLIRLLTIFFITAFGAITGWTIWHLRVRFYKSRYDARVEREALSKHFNYILKFANDIILLMDQDLKIVEANDRAIEFYQYGREELLGMSIYKLRLPEYDSQLKEKLNQLSKTGSATYETFHRRKDGKIFAIEISARHFEIEGTKYYQSIGRDITARKAIEAKLNQLIERYDLATHAARLAVWDYDLVYDNLIWDDMVYELYGVKKENFPPVYSSWLNLLYHEDAGRADEEIRNAIKSGNDYTTEFRVAHSDGTLRTIRAIGHVVKNDEGVPVRLIGINYDITDQKNAENLLKEREFWLSESQKVGKIGSYIFNIETMIWSSSEVLDEIFGIDRNYDRSLNGWNLIVHPYDREYMLNYVKEYVIQKGNFFDREYRIVNCRTGDIQWVYGRGELSYGSDGRPIRMIGTIQDITRRKTAETELENSFWLLKATIESTADGLLVVDSSGKIVAYNGKFAQMWAIPDEVLEKRDDELALKYIIGQVSDPEKFAATVRDLYSFPEKISFDSIEFHDGKVFERYSQPQKINEKIVGRVWSFRDITHKRNAENQLIRAKEMAEESDRLKTAFLHNISHEIRTPMNAIVGFTALLDDSSIDDSTRRSYTGIITQSTNQLLALISDIVEISNIEAGQVKLSFTEVNINNLLKDLYIQFSLNENRKDLEFQYHTGMPDDRALINTDKTKLIQILTNLLSNAFKFTKEGSVNLGYRLEKNDLIFYVKDTGIGIPEDKIDKIFDRFFQVQSDSSRQFTGAGLGLSISKAYAELLGGKLYVNSVAGKGSEFCLIHPL
jgi:PAS domain S-box-containing protein